MGINSAFKGLNIKRIELLDFPLLVKLHVTYVWIQTRDTCSGRGYFRCRICS